MQLVTISALGTQSLRLPTRELHARGKEGGRKGGSRGKVEGGREGVGGRRERRRERKGGSGRREGYKRTLPPEVELT